MYVYRPILNQNGKNTILYYNDSYSMKKFTSKLINSQKLGSAISPDSPEISLPEKPRIGFFFKQSREAALQEL